jgi:hypothetical protein
MFRESVVPIRAVLGRLGDLDRATLGEGETEPKQIGEATQDSIEQIDLGQGNVVPVSCRPISGATAFLRGLCSLGLLIMPPKER